jgi:hypothetical protein
MLGFARVPGRQFLIEIYAQARLIVGVHIAVPQFRTAWKDFKGCVLETAPLLDTEVWTNQVQVNIGGMTLRGNIAGAMSGGPHAEGFAENCQFPRRRDAADLADVNPDKIYEPLFNQKVPFFWIVV